MRGIWTFLMFVGLRAVSFVRPTNPIERNETLSRRLDTNVFIKYELFQRTGSLKARGRVR